jgi:hypothetical protein
VSDCSRASSDLASTVVGSPVIGMASSGKRKRKKVDDPEDAAKVADTKVLVEMGVAFGRTTRARQSKMTLKAAAAVLHTEPVDGERPRPKRRKTKR